MLLIWTDHDPVTAVLATAAKLFASEARMSRVGHCTVEPPDSVGHIVKPLLATRNRAVFFFGHGTDSPGDLVGNDGATVIAVADSVQFGSRVLCAVACHGTVGIGPHIASAGGATVGFDDELGVPLVEPFATMFADAALAGPRELLRGGTAKAAAEASEQAFRILARTLLSGLSVQEHVLGVVMDLNADAASTAGDPSLTA